MTRRPLGAITSQMIVAGSSLLLSIIALRELGTAGLGTFSLLFGILVTANSVQTGWIGDSLTVLDRFDPGIRRALFQSQAISLLLIGCITALLGGLVHGVDASTAITFGVASAVWALEETMRRLLMARRQFWALAVNDASFAFGAFGLLVLVRLSGSDITILALIVALLAGAATAIVVGTVQLPRVELLRGPPATSRVRDLSSFAGWRAVQVGLRPASLALMRVIVAAAASIEAVGELEAARLIVAPALTILNGAGVFFLPTYAAQAKRGRVLHPSPSAAMVVLAAMCTAYGVTAVVARGLLSDLVGDHTAVSAIAVGSWALYVTAFGVGLPAGAATVATGRSRQTFLVRAVDTTVGLAVTAALAGIGWIDATPLGLAVGAFVGAGLLMKSLHHDPLVARVTPEDEHEDDEDDEDDGSAYDGRGDPVDQGEDFEPAHWRWTPLGVELPASTPQASIPPPPPAPRARNTGRRLGTRSHAAGEVERAPTTSPRTRLRSAMVWIAPLLLILAVEYKLRRRDIDGALNGRIDAMIAAELLLVGALGAWSLWRLVPAKPRLSTLLVLMWGYILTTAASAIYSVFPGLAMARAVELVVVGCVVSVVATQGDFTSISRLLHGWVALISVSILAGLAYVAPTTGPQQGRFTWFSVHSVTTGSMFAVSVPILFGLWLAAGRRRLTWPRWAYGGLLAVHIVFLLLTRTRGSIGGVAVALGVMAWLSSGRRAQPSLMLGGLVGSGAVTLTFGRVVLEFLTRGETVDQIGTFNRRTEIWSLAWDSFLEHPVFGLGFNSAKGVFFEETGLGGAHNSLINVMIDVGSVGLVWWLGLIAVTLVTLGRLRKIERRAPVLLGGATGTARFDGLILIGMFTAMLVNSITTEGLGAGVNVMAIWLFLACAWLTLLDQDQKAVLSAQVATREQSSTLDAYGASGGDGRGGLPWIAPVPSVARSR